MTPEERNRHYEQLLSDDNIRLLMDIAVEAANSVINKTPKPKQGERSLVERTAINDLQSIREKVWAKEVSTSQGPIRYTSIMQKFKHRLENQRNYQTLRNRCIYLPKLYEVLIEHRNFKEHDKRGQRSRPDVAALCGVVLSILDISTLTSDKTQGLRDQCTSLLRSVAKPDSNENIESDQESRLADAQQEIEELRRGNEQLKQLTKGREDGQEPSTAEQIADRLADHLQERLTKPLQEDISLLTGNVDFLLQLIVDAKSPQLPKDELFKDDPDAWEALLYDQHDHENQPDNQVMRLSSITPSMAEERLRDLRDEIRRDMKVEGWENICMFNPIVREAVKQANASGLKTIEDWKRIEAVKDKYSNANLKPTMDKQIERYGHRMMRIYHLIEKKLGGDKPF